MRASALKSDSIRSKLAVAILRKMPCKSCAFLPEAAKRKRIYRQVTGARSGGPACVLYDRRAFRMTGARSGGGKRGSGTELTVQIFVVLQELDDIELRKKSSELVEGQ